MKLTPEKIAVITVLVVVVTTATLCGAIRLTNRLAAVEEQASNAIAEAEDVGGRVDDISSRVDDIENRISDTENTISELSDTSEEHEDRLHRITTLLLLR